jgi:hypothetical protein
MSIQRLTLVSVVVLILAHTVHAISDVNESDGLSQNGSTENVRKGNPVDESIVNKDPNVTTIEGKVLTIFSPEAFQDHHDATFIKKHADNVRRFAYKSHVKDRSGGFSHVEYDVVVAPGVVPLNDAHLDMAREFQCNLRTNLTATFEFSDRSTANKFIKNMRNMTLFTASPLIPCGQDQNEPVYQHVETIEVTFVKNPKGTKHQPQHGW